jgi:hypothetical protein
VLNDPRDRGGAEEGETGLGALPPAMGRFLGLRLVGGFVQVEYRVADGVVKERLSGAGAQLFRDIEVAAHDQPLGIVTGPGDSDRLAIPPSREATRWRVVISENGTVVAETAPPFPAAPAPARRWPAPVIAAPAIPPAKDAAWVFDDLPLPIPNPWKRNVRVADLAFFPEGRAALVTFDGDVWIADGLENNAAASWSRFASGLHEPQNLAIRDGQILVFDRNGIVALHDTDGNGEADWHENVSNGFAQSAETRQYANDFIARPDGAFDVAIGGQVGSTIGKLNGTVIRIAPSRGTGNQPPRSTGSRRAATSDSSRRNTRARSPTPLRSPPRRSGFRISSTNRVQVRSGSGRPARSPCAWGRSTTPSSTSATTARSFSGSTSTRRANRAR